MENLIEESGLFDQKINFVELTKLLERDTCDTLTFTYPLGHDYSKGATYASYVDKLGGTDAYFDKGTATKLYISPVFTNNKIDIKNIQLRKDNQTGFSLETTISVIQNGVRTVVKVFAVKESGQIPDGTVVASATIMEGAFTIEYKAKHPNESPSIPKYGTLTYEMQGLDIIPDKPIPSITDVVNRILSVGLARKENEPQKYTLDPAFAEKYSKVQAPEFHITRSTLYEALLQVGGYIQAIPRLDWNEVTDDADIITFDELGETEEYIPPEGLQLIAYQAETNPDEYCGTIDSYVDNIVSTVTPKQGSITEPSADSYRTTRTENGDIVIEDDSVIITTEFPIYRITSLEMGYLKNGKLVGEILPYVFEQSEYDALTGYKGTYPYAKEFAVCFKQGDNKITGLTLKANAKTSIGISANEYAIRNIVSRGIPDEEVNSTNICDMAFRITYMPIISARVKQRKAYTSHPFDNTLFYQQSANTVESDYYGENMKGYLARIGNEVEVRTYRFRSPLDLPKVGQMWNDKYVSQVDIEYDRHWVKASIYLTPYFNRLSQYIGINSNYRLYDVSEKQSVRRDINYSENVYIGNVEEAKTSLTTKGIDTFGNIFKNQERRDVGLAVVQGRTADNTPIATPTVHSCVSFAMGNALTFVWQFEDNYSAGRQAGHLPSKIETTKKLQKIVPYGDNFGELYKLGFLLKTNMGKTFSFVDQQSTLNNHGFCDKLPEVDGSVFNYDNTLIDFNSVPLIVEKDSREALAVTTQLHMIANRDSIVLGHELTHKNPLVSGTAFENEKSLVFLPYKINMLLGLLNTTNAFTALDGAGVAKIVSINEGARKVIIGSVTNNTQNTYKSWAIINPKNRKLYIGENINLTAGASTKEIIFNF